jgi:hypothetical protein
VIAIQPCALVLLVGADWQVETVSANLGMIGDFKPASVVGHPLGDLIDSKSLHNLRNRMAWLASDESEVHDFGVEWGEVALDLTAIRGEDHYLIEAELAVESRLPDSIGMVRTMTDRLASNEPLELATQAMRQIRSLTGFEQVFLCDRGGNVLADGSRERGPVDQTYEVVDLPRLVADHLAEPVPLVGNVDNPLLHRAAYLAAEETGGAAATMSLPLRTDGKLVAMVHARNSAPRRCGAERRSVAHLFAERVIARMARHGWAA